jgi:glycolate oxidase iron-sulfur subunit
MRGAALQTHFTQAQRARPEIAEADGILRTCVHYGFCTATCPTYVLTRDENDSPRGRIDLIREMLESDGAPDPKTVYHLDRCLSCLSCMSTCAVKVDYAHLIDIARAHIERHYRRPLRERALRRLLAWVLPYPRRFRAALSAARIAGPVAAAVPGRLGGLMAMAQARPVRPQILAPGVYPAEGQRRMRVALLAGCAQQVLESAINAASLRVLRRHGCEVVIPDGAGCCGALPLHMGFDRQAAELAVRNVRAWSGLDALDAIVVNASGCGTTVKDYGHVLKTAEAEALAAKTLDITELLARLDLQPAGSVPAYRVAYHDACSLQHGQKVTSPPRALLKQTGFTVLDIPEGHFCCGSAGTYNLLQPAMAETLGRRKAGHADSVDPDIVAAGNLGCMVQIGRYAAAPLVHTAELLDWATGGPRPPALEGRALCTPPPAPRASPPTPSAPAAPAAPPDIPSGPAGFW